MNQEQSKKYIEIVKSGKMDDMFDYGKEIGKLETASSPSTSFEDWEIGFEKLIRIEERNDCPPVPVINVAETRAFIKSLLTQSREQQKAEWIEKLNFAGHGDGGVYDDYGKGYFGAIKDIINLLTTPE